MSKTLSNILTVFKVVRIIAKIVFILCIVGGVGCLLGSTILPMVGGLLPTRLLEAEGIDISSATLACVIGVVACAGEAVFAFLAERYFKGVLDAGTPFTFEGAKESFRLGVTSIVISVAVSVIAGILALIIALISPMSVAESDISTSVSISTGLIFMFLSVVFKHGAELKEVAAVGEENQEEQASEFESL